MLGSQTRLSVIAQLLVNWVRSVKSEAELKYMREAAVLTDLGMQAGFDAIEVARRDNEVTAEVLYAMTLGTPEIGGFACPPPMRPTGQEFSTTYHTTWSDRRYRAGTSTGFAGPATSWSSRCSSASCDTLVACWLRASSWRARSWTWTSSAASLVSTGTTSRATRQGPQPATITSPKCTGYVE